MSRRTKGCPNCDGTGRPSCPMCGGANVPFPEESGPDYKKILREFVQDIDATGGVCKYEDTDFYAPVADKDWTDLADTYIKACKALHRRPHIEKEAGAPGGETMTKNADKEDKWDPDNDEDEEEHDDSEEGESASFSTVCPYCKKKGKLEVVHFEVTTAIPLTSDGFATTDAELFETAEEVVHCTACDKEFPLSGVTL